ncbi:MAG TPA: hypothetical protein DD671_06690 [Balneolaceae bacterium]|nr:hypothetical protein [Balneolaceae bacterium]
MKYLLLLCYAGVLLLTGCADSGVNEKIPSKEAVFLLEGETLVPNGSRGTFFNEEQKLKSVNFQDISEEQKKALKETLLNYSKNKKSPYVGFISYKKNKKFKYKYFRLNPDKEDIKASSRKKVFKYVIFVDPESKEPYRIVAAIIPDTKSQKQAILDWASKFGFKPENKKTKTTSPSKQKTTMHCYWQEVKEWDSELNNEHLYTIWVCEEQQLDPGGDDGGGTGGCDYPGGGCDEDPDPNDPPGGGSGNDSDPDPESCPVGQVEDTNGDCIDGEVPCVGNPVKNPRIAEQTNSGINGERKGYTRSQGSQFHSGLDINNDIGKPWFAPFSGNIEAYGYDEDLGHHVTIRFQKNGVYYTMQFGHLQEDSWPPNGSSIEAGDVIGIQGLSGNLRNAIRTGATDDIHSHIIIRKRTGSGWDTGLDYGNPLNPETFYSTKFDSNGNPISGTDC